MCSCLTTVLDAKNKKVLLITHLCFSSSGFVLVLNKPSNSALVSLMVHTKAWNSSPPATSRPRRVFIRPAGWRQQCQQSSKWGRTWSSPRSRGQQAEGPVGWWEEPDQIAPPWTSPQMAHHLAVSPRPSQRRPASIPATTCRHRNEAQAGEQSNFQCRYSTA